MAPRGRATQQPQVSNDPDTHADLSLKDLYAKLYHRLYLCHKIWCELPYPH